MIELGLEIVSTEVVVVGTRSEGREPLASVYRVSFHTGLWSERDRFRRGRPARLDLPARGHRNSVREIPDKVKLRFAPQHHQQSVPVPPSFPLEPERSLPAGQ